MLDYSYISVVCRACAGLGQTHREASSARCVRDVCSKRRLCCERQHPYEENLNGKYIVYFNGVIVTVIRTRARARGMAVHMSSRTFPAAQMAVWQ